jgi:hypothetical protein
VKENGDELCAATPCDHGFAADMSMEHKVVFARAGYRPETHVVHGTDSQVAVTLIPVKAWVPPPRPPNPKPSESGSTPQGFKDIPY